MLAFLGYTNLSNLKTDMLDLLRAETQAAIPAEVDRAFDANRREIVQRAINEIQADLDSKIAFIQFTLAATALDERDTWSVSDRDAAFSLLETTLKSPELRSSPEFISALHRFSSFLFEADLVQDIDRLDQIVGDVAVNSDQIVKRFVFDYGIRVAGAPEPSPNLVTRFEKYAAAAHRRRLMEFALPFQLAFSFRKAERKRNPATDGLLQDSTTLVQAEQQTLIGLIGMVARADQDPNATGRFQRAAQLFQQLQATYEPEPTQLSSLAGASVPMQSTANPENILRELGGAGPEPRDEPSGDGQPNGPAPLVPDQRM